jgi:hypothetical protein
MAAPTDKKNIPAALRKRKKNQSWLGTDLEDSGRGRKERVNEWNRILDEIEEKVQRLKRDYDRYFMKLEKREPIMDRSVIERMLRHFDIPRGTPAHIKFRFQNLLQRFAIMKTYWERCLRQLEEGRYHRFKARLSAPADDKKDPKAKHRAKTGVVQAAEGQNYKDLYKTYVLAQKECGGPIPSYAVFSGSLKKRASDYRKKSAGKTLGFEVVTKDGSVQIEPAQD